jgi:hypothetical protein
MYDRLQACFCDLPGVVRLVRPPSMCRDRAEPRSRRGTRVRRKRDKLSRTTSMKRRQRVGGKRRVGVCALRCTAPMQARGCERRLSQKGAASKCPAQSKSHRPLRFGVVGSGSVESLDGDRLARWARAGAGRLGGVPVTRWGRVRSARVGGREAPTEPMGAVWAVRPEGEVGTRD